VETQISPEIIKQLAAAFQALAEQKSADAGPTGPASLFGSGGIFSTPGVEPDVITAYVRPHGLITELPRMPSTYENPRFATITGFTDTVGSEPAQPCDDAPMGYMKGCNLTAAFGRLSRSTPTIEFDKVMLRLHRGISTDLALRGRVLGLGDMAPAGLSEADILNIYTMAEMVTVGVNIERELSRMIWQGTPANNNVGGGYKECPGLDNQIATGQVDADTETACEALDSDVKNFNNNPVTGSSPSIVEYMSMMEFYLRYNAERMGLMPVEWVIAMTEGLWFELTEIWPCQYNTNRCASAVVGDQSRTVLDGGEMRSQIDAMRTGKYIDINGHRYRVITDSGILEESIGYGTFRSSIYFIPLTITGGFQVTYLEYVDYRAGARDTALLRGNETFWTDRGMYSWAAEFQKWCYKLSCKIEPRIVLRTPQLAGRIDDVLYEPLQHVREPYPDSPYFKDGGVSLRGGESLHAVWL